MSRGRRVAASWRAVALAAGLVLPLTLPAGCVPVVSGYTRVEAPGGIYFKKFCTGTVGPPDIVYYPFEGIFISVQIYPTLIGLHLPAGTIAQLQGDTVTMSGRTAGGSVNEVLRLTRAPQNMIGTSWPPEFHRVPELYDPAATALEPISGASFAGYHRWYLFVASQVASPGQLFSPPPGLVQGTIELPPMIINGRSHPAQVLKLGRRTYAELMPVDC